MTKIKCFECEGEFNITRWNYGDYCSVECEHNAKIQEIRMQQQIKGNYIKGNNPQINNNRKFLLRNGDKH